MISQYGKIVEWQGFDLNTSGGAYSAPPDDLAGGEGARSPLLLTLWASVFGPSGLRQQLLHWPPLLFFSNLLVLGLVSVIAVFCRLCHFVASRILQFLMPSALCNQLIDWVMNWLIHINPLVFVTARKYALSFNLFLYHLWPYGAIKICLLLVLICEFLAVF